jgi:hypothetical protein
MALKTQHGIRAHLRDVIHSVGFVRQPAPPDAQSDL